MLIPIYLVSAVGIMALSSREKKICEGIEFEGRYQRFD